MSSFAINSSFVVSDVSWLDDEKELQRGAQKDAETLQDAQDLAEVCTDKGLDEGVAYLKEKWRLEKQSPPKAVQALVTSPLYLAVWSAALGLDGLSYKDKDRPPAITEIPLRECVAATISSCVTIVTLLDGLTASAGVQRHLHAKKALQCGLTELTRAWATPHWLLSSEIQKTLGTRSLGKNCEAALKEQLKIGLNPLFQGKPKQPISLLWPSSVIKGVSVADLRNSFKALTGVDPGAATTPQELKQAAALYAKWTRTPPSLANIEAIVRRRTSLFAHLALVWTLSPLEIRAAYKATAAATVDALKSTPNSKGFINKLLDLLEETKQPAKAVPVSKPAVKGEPLKPENEQSGDRSRGTTAGPSVLAAP